MQTTTAHCTDDWTSVVTSLTGRALTEVASVTAPPLGAVTGHAAQSGQITSGGIRRTLAKGVQLS